MRESDSITVHAVDVQAMRALGGALASSLGAVVSPFVVALEGELGAGKTTLVGAVLNALGVVGPVRSPTYTLIEPYELAGRTIYHIDLYRLAEPREVEALGLRDLQIPHALFLIEWPQRAAGMLPPVDLAISIRYAPSAGRRVALTGMSKAGQDTLLAFTAVAKP